MNSKEQTYISVNREIFLNLIAAAKSARSWMATQAPGTDYANKIRQQLHNAIQPAIASNSDGRVVIVLGE